jgi:hypothetical protein
VQPGLSIERRACRSRRSLAGSAETAFKRSEPEFYLTETAGYFYLIMSSPGDDEIIRPATKPFSSWRADVPKPWLSNNSGSEAPRHWRTGS